MPPWGRVQNYKVALFQALAFPAPLEPITNRALRRELLLQLRDREGLKYGEIARLPEFTALPMNSLSSLHYEKADETNEHADMGVPHSEGMDQNNLSACNSQHSFSSLSFR
jgi:hypothetical protein